MPPTTTFSEITAESADVIDAEGVEAEEDAPPHRDAALLEASSAAAAQVIDEPNMPVPEEMNMPIREETNMPAPSSPKRDRPYAVTPASQKSPSPRRGLVLCGSPDIGSGACDNISHEGVDLEGSVPLHEAGRSESKSRSASKSRS